MSYNKHISTLVKFRYTAVYILLGHSLQRQLLLSGQIPDAFI